MESWWLEVDVRTLGRMTTEEFVGNQLARIQMYNKVNKISNLIWKVNILDTRLNYNMEFAASVIFAFRMGFLSFFVCFSMM